MTESTTVTEEKESIEENVKVDKDDVDKGDVVEEASKGKSEKATEEVSGDVSSSDAIADLSIESKAILEKIESMTVLELSKLVKALEDKFGVVAAAPAVAMPASAAAGSDGGDAAPATVDVVLTGCGDKKIQVLKAVRELTGLGLKEAKEVVDNVPKVVKEGVSKEEAADIKKSLEEQGAQVEIK